MRNPHSRFQWRCTTSTLSVINLASGGCLTYTGKAKWVVSRGHEGALLGVRAACLFSISMSMTVVNICFFGCNCDLHPPPSMQWVSVEHWWHWPPRKGPLEPWKSRGSGTIAWWLIGILIKVWSGNWGYVFRFPGGFKLYIPQDLHCFSVQEPGFFRTFPLRAQGVLSMSNSSRVSRFESSKLDDILTANRKSRMPSVALSRSQ